MKKDDNFLQIITTLLAYTLPLLQFFFGVVPKEAVSIFLFQENFLVVSIFTAVISYIMILVVKINPYYTWIPFQMSRKRKNIEWNVYTNPSRYTTDQIVDYQAKNRPPKPINSIDSNNIVPKLLVPAIAITFILFFIIGLLNQLGVISKSDVPLYLLVSSVQMCAYVCFIVSTVLALASQFLRESGARSFRKENSARYERVIELARKRDGFNEYKPISLITQTTRHDPQGITYHIFYLKVDNMYYIVVADVDIDMIYSIRSFVNKNDADQFMYTPDGDES